MTATPHHGHAHDGPRTVSRGEHPKGHNARPSAHHHSTPHVTGDRPEREELEQLCSAFIDGFLEARDKISFLRLAGVPFETPGSDGLAMKLVDIDVHRAFQVGTASPGFGSRELVYMPFAGNMVRERCQLSFVYVSLTERRDLPLAQHIEATHHPSRQARATRALARALD